MVVHILIIPPQSYISHLTLEHDYVQQSQLAAPVQQVGGMQQDFMPGAGGRSLLEGLEGLEGLVLVG